MLEIEPIVFTCRGWTKGTDKYAPYQTVMTLQRVGHVGLVSGLHGELSIELREQFMQEARKLGITELQFVRQKDQLEHIYVD